MTPDVAVSLGRLCPCGAKVAHRCAWCYRALCAGHYAHGPFAEDGAVVLKPVCWPKCDAPWWETAGRAEVQT